MVMDETCVVDEPKRGYYHIYNKFRFLITSEHFKEFGLDKIAKAHKLPPDKSDGKRDTKKIPVGVRMMASEKQDIKLIPPCDPKSCCKRNPISAGGPQERNKPDYSTIEKAPPPSTTYKETIGKTGQEIFRGMREYQKHLLIKQRLQKQKSEKYK